MTGSYRRELIKSEGLVELEVGDPGKSHLWGNLKLGNLEWGNFQ